MNVQKVGRALFLFGIGAAFGSGLFLSGIEAVRAEDEQPVWWNEENYTVIGSDAVWSGTVVVQKPVVIVNGATLTVEKGARVELGEDMTVVDGTLVAQGTERERVTFTKGPAPDLSMYDEAQRVCFSRGTGIRFSDTSNGKNALSMLRYAIVEALGVDAVFNDALCPYAFSKPEEKTPWRLPFVETAYAQNMTTRRASAVTYSSGQVRIENTEFRNNVYADIEANLFFDDEQAYADALSVVNSNFEPSVATSALLSTIAYGGTQKKREDFFDRVLLKNNWYGNANGPSGERFDEDDVSRGKWVDEDATVEGWRKNNLIADPVIVVPGILGSSQVFGEWKMDPITHIYDDFMESLRQNGYEEGINLFSFPYDWKKDNAVSALLLEGKIVDVKKATNVSKVDVVAHSMGGLVARAYIAGLENAEYHDDIDQLITLGTPQRGAPESYLKWEAGEGFFSWGDVLVKHHLEQQAEEAGYNNNLFGYVRDKVPSVEELLPVYAYLYDTKTKSMRAYPTGYPRNAFLEEINGEKSMQAIESVRFTNIAGKTEDPNLTLKKVRVESAGDGEKWQDGKPENFGNDKTDQGLEYGEGDATVPLESAKGIAADETIEIASTHTELPTKAQCNVFSLLTNRGSCRYVDKTRVTNVLLFKVFSPVDMQVLDPDGNVLIGKDFETGAIVNRTENGLGFYSGWEGVTNEFITIPNPRDGVYTVRTQGTGEGEYRVEGARLSEGVSGAARESIAEITGIARVGAVEDHRITVVGESVTTEDSARDTTPPTIVVKKPVQNETLLRTGKLFADVSVNDDVSGAVQTEFFFDGKPMVNGALDLAYQHLGTHAITVRATDASGNVAKQDVSLTLSMNIATLLDNIGQYVKDGKIQKRFPIGAMCDDVRMLERRFVERKSMREKRGISERARLEQLRVLERQLLLAKENLRRHPDRANRRFIDPEVAKLLEEAFQFLRDADDK